MVVALHRPMAEAEFLAWEEAQDGRWEFDGFAPVAMVGGTAGHAALCANLVAALHGRLKGTLCRVFAEGLKVRADRSLRYPDALVACGRQDKAATVAANPVVVFEVLSPSTSYTDQVVKTAEYRATPAIKRYVMLAQDRVSATVYERRAHDWVGSLVTDPAAVLHMPEIGVSVPLGELYDGVLDDGALDERAPGDRDDAVDPGGRG